MVFTSIRPHLKRGYNGWRKWRRSERASNVIDVNATRGRVMNERTPSFYMAAKCGTTLSGRSFWESNWDEILISESYWSPRDLYTELSHYCSMQSKGPALTQFLVSDLLTNFPLFIHDSHQSERVFDLQIPSFLRMMAVYSCTSIFLPIVIVITYYV